MDVIFYEAFAEEVRVLKGLLPDGLDAEFTPQTIQASRHDVPPAGLISIRTQSMIPASWTENLTGVLSRSAGFDHLEQYRKETGFRVPCGHLANYCSRAVAEQAVLLMMALMRKLPKQLEQFNVFSRDGLTGWEMKGRHALVLGVGNIGSEIVDLVQGLGMEVKGVDINPKKSMEYVDLDEGLVWAHAIFCALPLTEETRGLLGHRRLRQVENGPVLINIARGEITPVADLARLMGEELLGGVALDVFPEEQKLADALRDPSGPQSSVEDIFHLQTFGNVLFTPHNAFNTEESLRRKCQQTVEAISMFLSEGRFPQTVQ